MFKHLLLSVSCTYSDYGESAGENRFKKIHISPRPHMKPTPTVLRAAFSLRFIDVKVKFYTDCKVVTDIPGHHGKNDQADDYMIQHTDVPVIFSFS